MVGGNDIIEFEEAHYDELVDAYMEKFGEVPDSESQKWNDFVMRCYSERDEGYYGGEDR